jgi:hypothetical protein
MSFVIIPHIAIAFVLSTSVWADLNHKAPIAANKGANERVAQGSLSPPKKNSVARVLWKLMPSILNALGIVIVGGLLLRNKSQANTVEVPVNPRQTTEIATQTDMVFTGLPLPLNRTESTISIGAESMINIQNALQMLESASIPAIGESTVRPSEIPPEISVSKAPLSETIFNITTLAENPNIKLSKLEILALFSDSSTEQRTSTESKSLKRSSGFLGSKRPSVMLIATDVQNESYKAEITTGLDLIISAKSPFLQDNPQLLLEDWAYQLRAKMNRLNPLKTDKFWELLQQYTATTYKQLPTNLQNRQFDIKQIFMDPTHTQKVIDEIKELPGSIDLTETEQKYVGFLRKHPSPNQAYRKEFKEMVNIDYIALEKAWRFVEQNMAMKPEKRNYVGKLIDVLMQPFLGTREGSRYKGVLTRILEDYTMPKPPDMSFTKWLKNFHKHMGELDKNFIEHHLKSSKSQGVPGEALKQYAQFVTQINQHTLQLSSPFLYHTPLSLIGTMEPVPSSWPLILSSIQNDTLLMPNVIEGLSQWMNHLSNHSSKNPGLSVALHGEEFYQRLAHQKNYWSDSQHKYFAELHNEKAYQLLTHRGLTTSHVVIGTIKQTVFEALFSKIFKEIKLNNVPKFQLFLKQIMGQWPIDESYASLKTKINTLVPPIQYIIPSGSVSESNPGKMEL